jgi:tripartite-type tricarboxylate transporter receptor subunit TctC
MRAFLAFLVLALSAVAAQAEGYPNRPIRVIVPQPPGGVVDVSARIVSEKLGGIFGQQIIIESRPGGYGMLAAGVVARAPADGYTLLFCSGDVITLASLKPHTDANFGKRLLPIAMVNGNPLLVAANTKAPFSDIKQMVEVAKASADPLAYGTPGQGSLNDVLGRWIALEAHIQLQHIPYQGGALGAAGVAAGEIPLGVFSPPAVYPSLVEAGKVKILAISSKDHPPYLPSTWPTLIESGLPIDMLSWQGLFAPADTPEAIVSRLDQAVRQALQDESIAKRMQAFGTAPQYMPRTAFAERVRTDAERYAQIIQRAGIEIER